MVTKDRLSTNKFEASHCVGFSGIISIPGSSAVPVLLISWPSFTLDTFIFLTMAHHRASGLHPHNRHKNVKRQLIHLGKS
jgi:hypothetical protein